MKPAEHGRLDWALLAAVLGLVLVGSLLVWSSTAQRPDLLAPDSTRTVLRHGASVLVGIVVAVPVALCGGRRLSALAPAGYIAVLAGLVLVLFAGREVNGSRSWIALSGESSVQPGEFAKLAVVVGMATVLTERPKVTGAGGVRPGPCDLGWALLAGAVPIVLVGLQPDLGTVLVLTAIAFAVLALAGASLRWLVAIAAVALAGAAAAVRLGLLADYQIDRLTVLLHPELDPTGAGYNVLQAKLAIAAGGRTGQGLFQGPRTGGGFVPAQHTDFLFTVAGEELGYAGCMVILVLVSIVLWRGIRIAERAPDRLGRLVAAGVVCWLAVQTFQNVGMTLGLTPVAGVPLPFMSYGGSAMVSCLLAVALLQNIHLRQEPGR